MIVVKVDAKQSLDILAAGRRISNRELGCVRFADCAAGEGGTYRQVHSRTLTRNFPDSQVWIDEAGRLAVRKIHQVGPLSVRP